MVEVTRPSADCQTTFLRRFKQFGKTLKKVAERSRDSGRRSRDRRPTVKQRFLDVSSDLGKFWKKSLNNHATVVEVTRPSADCQTTFFERFKELEQILKKVAERSRDNGWGHATVGRMFNNVFWTFQAIRKFFFKIRWTVTRQWSEVTRPSADCQTTFFRRFRRFGKILKKSLNGHATVVEVTRPSADCQTTFFGRFKQLENFLKKVAERSRDSGRRSRDRRPTVKQRFLDVSSDLGKFWRKSLNGHATVVEVTRPSADCQTTFFGRFKQLENFLKKVAERSRDSGRRSRDRRPTVKQRFLDVSSDLGKFWKKSLNGHATVVEVTRPSADCQTTFFRRFKHFGKILKKVAERSRDSGRRSRDRRPTVKQRFLDVSSDLGKFWKKSLNGHATVVEVTRPSADCQTTFLRRFKQFGKTLKKVAERSRDSGRRSRDRRPTVKKRFLDVSSDLEKFWKKSLNNHATVVEVTRPSADCQTTFFERFKELEQILKKVAERSRDSGRRSRDHRPTVEQRFLDVSSDLGKFWKKSLNGHATMVEVTRPSADCQTTFLDVSSN